MDHEADYRQFKTWYDGEQERFAHWQYRTDEIAYAAWLAGTKHGQWLQAHEDAQKPRQDADEVWRKLW